MNLSLEKIIINAGTQSRAKIDEQTVAEYADRMMDGDVFPPVIVFYNGKDYWLADGFHRFFAAKRCAAPNIKCEVLDGDLRHLSLLNLRQKRAPLHCQRMWPLHLILSKSLLNNVLR